MSKRNDKPAEEIIFDANLDEFATRVGLIVGLESNEKMSSEEAYQSIKSLWKKLKKSRKNLLAPTDAQPPDGGEPKDNT